MKHEITTLNTKKSLAESLKKFMKKKPLAKITVSEIIADCGVNRKTFYYHFDDIYSLLKWMLEKEAIEVVKQFDLLLDYREAVIFVMNYVRKNKHLLCCAYDSIGRDEMKRFFYADFIGIVKTIIDNTEQQVGVHATADFKIFLSHFYTEAIAGMLIDEFMSTEGHDPSLAAEYLSVVLNNSLPSVLKNAPKAQ
ncbi:TetR/AcrR family transcriptional regulator C-terminal domain-containing protein [Enterococcus cecorum]|uniref:TetR/AcrR family transcriptional regulator C-terminal domain-containing protein n=1 Tax=Enterococcus cecorum TaxID=44008 RepID=UPI001FABA46B|nr:TetR/AcrR family transcriptional regulator C-terminal domain-containing protein [Enterococcus cecorum]MCJ0564807.1 TetR/AcrR family transcriptional regulator [Enterococcus cecorum]